MSDRFSADEARAIFERAARRQHAAPAPDGLSLDDLVAIGREAGLDPALVAAEAAGARIDDRPQKTWHGVPVGIRRSRLLPARVTDDEWARIVDLLREEYKLPGVAEQIGPRREWTTAANQHATRVTIERRADTDVVTVEVPDQYRLVALLLSSIFGFMGTGLTAVFLVTEPEAAVVGVMFVVLALVTYGSLLLGAKMAAARAPARLDRVLDRIDLISRSDDARTHAAPTLETPMPAASTPAFDLDDLGDAPAEAGRAVRTRVR